MGKVILDITMSLDGFIAGPNITPEQPMGEHGQSLHAWIFHGKTDTDANIIAEVVESSGAVIVGCRTYATAINGAWEGVSPFSVPAFVVCNGMPGIAVQGFVFTGSGIEDALTRAKAAAGAKNIWVMGGAGLIQKFLRAGLFDELHLHIAPLLLHGGTRLFDNIGAEKIILQKISLVDTPAATHIRFQTVK